MVKIDDLPGETTDDTITLKWREPESNGKVITMYTVYQRVVTDGKEGQWTEMRKIRDVSVRELKIELERGRYISLPLLQLMSLVKAQNKRKQISSKSRQKEVCSDESYFPLSKVYSFLYLVFKRSPCHQHRGVCG